MGGQALVTGSPDRVAAVGAALVETGYEVTAVSDTGELAQVCAALGEGSVDCYVQLPVDIFGEGSTALERVYGFLQQGLLTRFVTARTVLPCLADDSAVVLVSGNLLIGEEVADDQQARMALLRVLAHCLLADAGAKRSWVTVVDHRRSAEQIARIARERGQGRLRMVAEFAEQNADLSYDDWKLAVLSLSTGEL